MHLFSCSRRHPSSPTTRRPEAPVCNQEETRRRGSSDGFGGCSSESSCLQPSGPPIGGLAGWVSYEHDGPACVLALPSSDQGLYMVMDSCRIVNKSQLGSIFEPAQLVILKCWDSQTASVNTLRGPSLPLSQLPPLFIILPHLSPPPPPTCLPKITKMKMSSRPSSSPNTKVPRML